MKRGLPKGNAADWSFLFFFALLVLLASIFWDVYILNQKVQGSYSKPERPLALQPFNPVDDVRVFLIGKRADLNKATFEELIKAPGIGEKRAEVILNFRNATGFFLTLDELLWPSGPLSTGELCGLSEYFYVPTDSHVQRINLLKGDF